MKYLVLLYHPNTAPPRNTESDYHLESLEPACDPFGFDEISRDLPGYSVEKIALN
jgi:hypothetical protein